MHRSVAGQPAVPGARRHRVRGYLAILAAPSLSLGGKRKPDVRILGAEAGQVLDERCETTPPKRKFGLEKAWGDHPGLFSVEGIALAKCLAEQCFLRVGSPREGRHNPGQHDNEGRPAAEGQRLARGEQDQA